MKYKIIFILLYFLICPSICQTNQHLYVYHKLPQTNQFQCRVYHAPTQAKKLPQTNQHLSVYHKLRQTNQYLKCVYHTPPQGKQLPQTKQHLSFILQTKTNSICLAYYKLLLTNQYLSCIPQTTSDKLAYILYTTSYLRQTSIYPVYHKLLQTN